jgi:hypothetical protein
MKHAKVSSPMTLWLAAIRGEEAALEIGDGAGPSAHEAGEVAFGSEVWWVRLVMLAPRCG